VELCPTPVCVIPDVELSEEAQTHSSLPQNVNKAHKFNCSPSVTTPEQSSMPLVHHIHFTSNI